jgi:hypothetical protein
MFANLLSVVPVCLPHLDMRVRSCEGFAPSNEGRAAAELLDAFERNAPDVLQGCLSRQVFTFLDGPARLQLTPPQRPPRRRANEHWHARSFAWLVVST